jgi:hypothetical protein
MLTGDADHSRRAGKITQEASNRHTIPSRGDHAQDANNRFTPACHRACDAAPEGHAFPYARFNHPSVLNSVIVPYIKPGPQRAQNDDARNTTRKPSRGRLTSINALNDG